MMTLLLPVKTVLSIGPGAAPGRRQTAAAADGSYTIGLGLASLAAAKSKK
jgi:hypothetical protein